MRTVAETGSTNADVLALATTGLAEGSWLRAERQTAGRGRQGREWISPVGNLHASTLVRLLPADPAAPGLALAAGVAVAETLAALPLGFRALLRLADEPMADDAAAPLDPRLSHDRIVLKWPNDVLLAGGKVAGILLERAGSAVVVGIGVNVVHCPDGLDRPVTSLARHGVTITPDVLLAALVPIFAHHLSVWRKKGLDPVRSRWLDFAHPVGTPLTAHLPDGATVSGQFVDLDANGALRLGLADGATRVIHAADVFAV